MASAGDIRTVRQNVDEPTEDSYDDELIGALVAVSGVDVASATIWRRKAASFASLVSVSEAGASHSFGELYKNAVSMAEVFSRPVSAVAAGRAAVVTKIERRS